MSTDREIALEQALIAVLGAAKQAGVDVAALSNNAKGLVLSHSEYRQVEHPHVSNACEEIDVAALQVGGKAATFQTEVR